MRVRVRVRVRVQMNVIVQMDVQVQVRRNVQMRVQVNVMRWHVQRAVVLLYTTLGHGTWLCLASLGGRQGRDDVAPAVLLTEVRPCAERAREQVLQECVGGVREGAS